MAKSTLYKWTPGSTESISDEQYDDVGASTFQLGDIKRAFKGGDDLVIRTASGGGGTLLVEDTDYTVENEDFRYTDEEGFSVYTGIKIINATYQTGSLYISYECLGSYTDPTSFNTLTKLSDLDTALIGQSIEWTSETLPTVSGAEFMWEDGSAISRTLYPIAAARWIVEKGAVTFSSSSGLLATFVAHGFSTTAKVAFSTTDTLPTGISADTTYYVIYVSADTFRLATTIANALAGTAIAYTDAGADCTLISCPHGIKDSDEMYLPDYEGYVLQVTGQATINARAKDFLSMGAETEDRDQQITGQFQVRGRDESPLNDTVYSSGASGAFTVSKGEDLNSLDNSATNRLRDIVDFDNADSTSPHTARVGAYSRETKKGVGRIVRVA